MDSDGEPTPEIIQNVKGSRYSIARRYGRVTVNGQVYVYQRESDSLLRQDIFKQRLAQKRPSPQ
ncbi:hypothetical protein APB26_32260 [Pseudomonas aeruginosa]|uniref:hypothetical protein n=1 Tax=Pseudomonas TaxID=286 RepID=UPI00071BEC98|nr:MULTISPECIES: hypothetical protein [Pseudomonas]KSQ21660.1 hypothetical protein APB26_32260 [Pseudomonas aeruginosa]MDU4255498.1 hypothetical protein [Pseudomonas sp.]RPV61329.1 hypothetical protein IPC838_18590 [Pseudomonas aeruginosa]